jgi:DNA-binding LytR/AlgR family response regulator
MKFAVVSVRPEEEASLTALLEQHGYTYSVAGAPPPESDGGGFVFLKEGTVYYRVALKDILYVSSDHVYLSVYTDGRKFLLRSTMTAFLDRLLPAPFIRVHRSYAINGARVEQVENDAVVVAGKRIPTSKAGREQLMAILLIGN